MKYIKIKIFDYTWYLSVHDSQLEHVFTEVKSVITESQFVSVIPESAKLIHIHFVNALSNIDIQPHVTIDDIQILSFPVSIYKNVKRDDFLLFCKKEYYQDCLPFFLISPVLTFIAFQHIEDGIVPVHSISIVKEGKAVLLIGESGVGKSTCYKKVTCGWSGGSDDLSFLRLNNESNQIIPYPTWSNFLPWGKEKKQSWDISKRYVLQSVYILKKGNDKIKKILKFEAVMAIYRQLSNFFSVFNFSEFDKNAYLSKMRSLFQIAEEITKSYDVNVLEHSLNGDYCSLIEADIKQSYVQ